jgi:hypothetical protein
VGAAGKIGGSIQKDLNEVEKRKQANSFNNYKLLQMKMNMEKYNYDEKKQKHLEGKKEVEARVGPGAYINPKMHSEFKKPIEALKALRHLAAFPERTVYSLSWVDLDTKQAQGRKDGTR